MKFPSKVAHKSRKLSAYRREQIKLICNILLSQKVTVYVPILLGTHTNIIIASGP